MVTRAQVTRLAGRIEALEEQLRHVLIPPVWDRCPDGETFEQAEDRLRRLYPEPIPLIIIEIVHPQAW